MGEAVMQDGLTGALTDPFQSIHMGVTAENVATRYGISRAEQDALALESQRRAGNAIAPGYFRDQKNGRAHDRTTVTNAQLVCRTQLEKTINKQHDKTTHHHSCK